MWKPQTSVATLLLALIVPACAERPASVAAAGAGTQSAAGAPAQAGATLATGALKFIEDDAPAALAEAKRRGVPIFVEAWAPW